MDVAEIKNDQVDNASERINNMSFSEVLACVWTNADKKGSRASIFKDIGASLLANTTVGAVFHFSLSTLNDNDNDLSLLASRHSNVSANVEQWAVSVATKSCMSAAIQREEAPNQDSTTVRMIAAPFGNRNADQSEAIVVMFVGNRMDDELQLTLLNTTIRCISKWECNQQLALANQVSQDLAAINELVTRIEKSDSPEDACQRLADELEQFITCRSVQNRSFDELNSEHDVLKSEQIAEVYFALADDRDNVKLVAISNTNAIPQESRLVEYIESAMRECLSRNQSSEWPPRSSDRHALLCHRQLAQQHAAKSNFVSVPFFTPDGNLQGVLLTASVDPLPDRIRAFLDAVANPVSSSFSLLKRVERNRLTRWFEKTKASAGKNKFKTACKLATIALLAMLIPMPYTVSSICEVQPSARRFVAAPFDGTLKECLVEPGDIVAKNQVLARIDDREIKLELAEIEADLHRAIKLRDGHVATHESGEARVAFFETERLRARNELLAHRNDHLELKSPVDGVLISGDLQKAEGMPLEIGKSLFEIAPLKNLTIEISIPEDDIRYVQQGMTVRVRLDAFPFESWTGTIERVHPAAEIRDNENVFVAKVNIANDSGKLRPGMRGNAKTKTAWRPIGWNLFHKPVAKGLRWFGW